MGKTKKTSGPQFKSVSITASSRPDEYWRAAFPETDGINEIARERALLLHIFHQESKELVLLKG